MNTNEFYKQWGFEKEPFGTLYSEKESAFLKDFFVPPPHYDEIIGNSKEPESSFVFGYRGEGKSAIREMVKNAYENSQDSKIFIVSY